MSFECLISSMINSMISKVIRPTYHFLVVHFMLKACQGSSFGKA